ncbi:uncharacterized protein LAJ45_04861 [Morchella importuna]|uniref:uncharacterized protein n=1 Tax=Morchella importuna TaxID=1174673 RepID=UPI001E8D70DB|nr:uncharacterized protein LAJ45_04861 [Morchella importuna]KAH8151159.1 hypothetical protein LAJ45_04861 [Morchella importuna]
MVLDPKSLVPAKPAKERIYVRPLTLKDLDAVMTVETQAFVPVERCTRKQFHALLSTPPTSHPLSLGIFASTSTSPGTAPAAHNPTEHLLGHAIASKITSLRITDSCYSTSTTSHTTGATIALHSLAIVPACQRRTLGTTLLAEFIVNCLKAAAGVVERIAIIAREGLVRFYERFGFVCYGLSNVGFGGGGWRDLVLELSRGGGWGWRDLVVEFEKRGGGWGWRDLVLEFEKRGRKQVVMAAGCGVGWAA